MSINCKNSFYQIFSQKISQKSLVVGIDLGTTYTNVGILQNEQIEIITNEQGHKQTPSYVAFTENECLVGDFAKNQESKNPSNTIFNVKRLIGRRFNDPIVQKDIKLYPFLVEPDPKNNPLITVKYKEQLKKFYPEEILSILLAKMKENAEIYLNEPVKEAVITVPASFNNSQRQATMDAGKIAGLNVLRIINEPTAASLAYWLNKKMEKIQGEYNVLIFDLGGGTFDVSLIAIEDDLLEVKATAGNSHLGGEDFDNKIVEWCVGDFLQKKGIDISDNPKAKRILSSSILATVEVDSLAENQNYIVSITRAKFEELCREYFKECISLVEKVLEDANILKVLVHDVVLVGGSSRIPKIVQLVSDFFGGKIPNKSMNPNEAVAYGAAIQAAIYSKIKSQQVSDILLLDVNSLTLGFETAGGIMTTLIPRNTTIPVKISKIFTTYSDTSQGFSIKIYEGEKQMTKDDNLIGIFYLEDIWPAPRGVPQIEVTFDIDANCIINVTAIDKINGKNNMISIIENTGRLSKEQIDNLIKDANKLKTEGEFFCKKVETKMRLEQYCYSIINTIKDKKFKDKLAESDKNKIESCNNPKVEIQEYEAKQKQLEDLFNFMQTNAFDQGEIQNEIPKQIATKPKIDDFN